MNNTIKQTQQLLAELDALIEKDYNESLQLIEQFKQETESMKEYNTLSNQELFDLTEKIDIFDRNLDLIDQD